MFTGIVEAQGTIKSTLKNGDNIDFEIECSFAGDLKPDQSLAHNGVCLTVTSATENSYRVSAIAETLRRTNLGLLGKGDRVNLERSLTFNGRIDGHLVQGHVDATGVCTKIVNENGSHQVYFRFDAGQDKMVVSKGSICVDGVSLTVVEAGNDYFSVAIIPYTWEHTSLGGLKPGGIVNLEFDVLGKYVAKWLENRG